MAGVEVPGWVGAPVQPPYAIRWQDPDRPLPVQDVRSVGRPVPAVFGTEAPPWLATGAAGEPFDFGSSIARLAGDIVARTPDLGHIRTGRILFAITQARNGRSHGLQARVTPLRLRGGQIARRHGGVTYQVQRYIVRDEDILYLMTFCLPRFLNQSFDDKLVTVFHELYHIGPQFDGDLRRHDGRCAVHTRSQRRYDERMAALARAYLATRPDPGLHAFLRLNFAQLQRRHGRVIGVVVPRPKLIPLPASPA